MKQQEVDLMPAGGGPPCKESGLVSLRKPLRSQSEPTQEPARTVPLPLASKTTSALTQQDDDAEKDGDQSPRAESHGEKYGLGAAG